MPNPAAPEIEPQAAPPLTEDAYCPNCGYNVRELPGDPIRCPECGGWCDRAELRWPNRPRVTTRQQRTRRSLQRCADLCALATLPGLIGAAVLLSGSYVARQFALPLTSTAALIWVVGFTLFAWRCAGLPNWGRALAIYQLAAVPATFIDLMLVITGLGFFYGAVVLFAALDRLPTGISPRASQIVFIVFITVPLLLELVVVWAVVHFDLTEGLKRLGADRLNALADELVEQQPTPDAQAAPPSAGTSAAPPAGRA